MDPLIHGLLRADAYEHPCSAFEVLETHISWVILTGDFAYKLKKPVNFGFVDFTTLPQRRFCCAEELRLNSRLADDLYLAMKPVFGPRARASFVGTGEPIEFAVQMRQFPQSALLPAVLKRGELTVELIDQLALDVAQFQQTAAAAGPDISFGSPEAVREPVETNFRVLASRSLPSDRDAGVLVRQLWDWSDVQFGRLKDEFALRKSIGKVREGHGDMHLGNMVLRRVGAAIRAAREPASSAARIAAREPASSAARIAAREPASSAARIAAPTEDAARIEVFDCLEFNPSLRWIDVVSEIAFLVMDLADRRRPDLGWRFLNAWLEHTGDFAGLKLWSWYYCYRALVRAKVAALRCGQSDVAPEEAARLEQQLADYLELANRATQPEPPRLVITCGVSGSGKSYWSQRLAAERGWVRMRSDVERKRLYRDDDRYSDEATAATYRHLLEQARIVLNSGLAVLVDATFLHRAQRQRFRELARELNVPCQLLEFTAPEDVLRERIAERNRRGGDPSEATEDVLKQQLATQEAVGADEEWDVITHGF